MAKSPKKYRIISRLRRFTPSPKIQHRIRRVLIRVQASFHNTIVTVTNLQGRVLSCASAGSCGFRGKKKNTPFAAEKAVTTAVRRIAIRLAEVMIKGTGRGRNGVLRGLKQSGIRVMLIRDVTPIPHNGCRPPKRRRLKRNKK